MHSFFFRVLNKYRDCYVQGAQFSYFRGNMYNFLVVTKVD